MTDVAASGRGGVGVRVFVVGDEVVRRTFSNIADSGKKMWAEIATGQRVANPALRGLSALSNEAQGAVAGLAARAGPAGSALSAMGTTGLALAAALGVVAGALVKTREAMTWAADLTDAADRIGVGVEALQNLRYAADETGVPVASLESALERLNGTLGAFRTGIGEGRVKAAFASLRITPEDLKGMNDAADILPLLADRLGRIESRADQVQIARRLGIEELLPLLRQGSEGLNRFEDAARDLGLTIDENVVRSLDEADRQMEIAQQRIDSSLRLAVASLADDFATVATEIANVVQWLVKLNSIEIPNPGVEAGLRINHFVRDRVAGRSRAEGERYWNPLGRNIEDQLAGLASWAGDQSWPTDPAFIPDRVPAGGGAGRAERQAEREAEQRRQREDRFAEQLARAQDQALRAMQGRNRSLEDQLLFELGNLQRAAASREAAIEREVIEHQRTEGLRGLSRAEADELLAQERLLAAANERTAIDENALKQAERRLRLEEGADQTALEMLEISGQLARTERERFEVARRILAKEREIERRRLAFDLENDANLTPEERAARLAGFDQVTRGRVTVLDDAENNRLRGLFRDYGRTLVDAVEDGRLGEHIAMELRDRLLDYALNGVFEALFSGGNKTGGGGGLGGLISSGLNFLFGGRRASGGGLEGGFRYGLAEHGPELAVFGRDGHVFSAAETMRLLTEAGDANTGRAAPGATFDLSVNVQPSPYFDVRVERVARPMVEQSEARVRRDVPGAAVSAVMDYQKRTHGR